MRTEQGFPRSNKPAAVTRLTRRAAVAACLAAPLLPRFARAAEITWRLGHSAPADFAIQRRLMEVAAAIATRSDGQMELQIHPDSELGSPVGLLSQVRAGSVDAAPLTCQILAGDLATAALPMAGFAFSGYDRLWPAIDGDLGKLIRGQMNDRLGLVTMDRCWDFGFRQITTTVKPIRTAADVVGLRLRTPPEADFIGLFQALKALPLAMQLNALVPALTARSIDGQDSVVGLIKAAGLYRAQSLCALTNHVWDGQWLCTSGKSWSKLPSKLKDIVATALNEGALRQRQDTADDDTRTRKELEAMGMQFNPVDLPSFRSVLRQSGYYDAWAKRMGDEGFAALEKYAGRLK